MLIPFKTIRSKVSKTKKEAKKLYNYKKSKMYHKSFSNIKEYILSNYKKSLQIKKFVTFV